MSALPPKADIVQHGSDVRFVPKADILHCSNNAGLLGQVLPNFPSTVTFFRRLPEKSTWQRS
jgi:hypothetical protein